MSNTVMDITEPIEKRLTELEIKASFNEDLLEQLNAQVFRQQQLIDALVRELHELRLRSPEIPPLAQRDLREDLPPHY